MAHAGSRLKPTDCLDRHRFESQPSSRTGENPPYGMIAPMSTWPSLWTKQLGTPNDPVISCSRGTDVVATMVRNCYGLSGCSHRWTESRTGENPPYGMIC